MPIGLSHDDPGRAADDDVRARCRDLLERDRVGGADRQLAGRARAGRRRRRDHAVELPAAPDRGEGRAGARRRLHGRAQAERGRAAERVRARRDHRRGRRCPPGVFNLVTGIGPVVGEAIAAHPDVDMVSFTGSTRAGRRVSELAAQTVKRGRARARRQVAERHPRRRRPRGRGHRRRREVLPQLGPDLHRADADARAARAARRGRGDRRPRSRSAFTVGDPFDAETQLGPLVSDASASACAATSARASRRARKLVTGGAERAGGPRRAATSCSRRCSPTSRPT